MTTGDRGTPRRLILLGSTGSIGTNTLNVVQHLHDSGLMQFEIVGLAAATRATVVAEQAKRFGVEHAAIADEAAAATLTGVKHVYSGADAALQLVEAVARPGDIVLGAMVGSAGLPATIAAIEKGCDIALANKETLVAAGELVMPLVHKRGVQLLPDRLRAQRDLPVPAGRSVRSTRSSGWCITASGGPFRTWPADRVERATVEEALDHPTWSMGPKITVDSASLMNKALEVIEAHWLFGMPAEQDRRRSCTRSRSCTAFVEFVDGSVVAQLSPPDMKSPIQYALTWPQSLPGCAPTMDWQTAGTPGLRAGGPRPFPGPETRLGRHRGRGDRSGAIFNAANEVGGGRVPGPPDPLRDDHRGLSSRP